ncbi:MAG: hypothetical protein M3O06_10935 [Pseudomonadota bacterium]|nr:hypothetical protein [Pseudomonadota bacterium]
MRLLNDWLDLAEPADFDEAVRPDRLIMPVTAPELPIGALAPPGWVDPQAASSNDAADAAASEVPHLNIRRDKLLLVDTVTLHALNQN